MRTERTKKLKEYLQNLIIKKPGEHYNWKEILAILASLTTIGGGLGMLGGPIGSGIGAGVGIAVGGGIIITIELVNAYRLYKLEQQREEEHVGENRDNNDDDSDRPELAHNNNTSLELDDTDTQSSEESSENNKTPHKPSILIKVKENPAKLLHQHGLYKSNDPDLAGLTQEENILKPVRLGKH